jgi:hypothetical protein
VLIGSNWPPVPCRTTPSRLQENQQQYQPLINLGLASYGANRRDKEVFVFAVLFNDKIYSSPALRKKLQAVFWGGMFARYSRYKTQREQREKQKHHALWGAENANDSDGDDAELASERSGVQKAYFWATLGRSLPTFFTWRSLH